jgi:hypothetical protein
MELTAEDVQRERRAACNFYRHLVASLAAEMAVLVVAIATGAIAGWVWTALFVSCLALASHAAVVFLPSPPSATVSLNRERPFE